MERALYRYIVVENEDRELFLERFLKIDEFLDMGLLGKRAINFVHGNKTMIEKVNEKWEITTPFLTPFTSLYCPTKFAITQLEKHELSSISILLLEGDPFRRQNNVTLLKKIRKEFQLAHIVVGLMVLPRHQAYTDTLPEGEDLHLAQQKYMEEGYDTVVLKEIQDVIKLSDCYDPLYFAWRRTICHKVTKMDELIQGLIYDFKYLWEDLLKDSRRLPGTQAQKICSYDGLKRDHIDGRFYRRLWHRYVESGKKTLFPKNKKGGVFDFLPVYRQTIETTHLAIWNVDEDEKELIEKLEKAYDAMFENSKYAKITAPLFNDESDYEKVLSDEKSELFGIRAEFRDLYKNYIENEILNVIQKLLVERYNRLRGLLNES